MQRAGSQFRQERNLCSHPRPPNSPAPSGRHIPLLKELETLFDFGFYKYATPDGAENESQRDSNSSAQGCEGRATLGYVPKNIFNAEGVASICYDIATTPSELFSFFESSPSVARLRRPTLG
jgi:hypothetical protein